MTPTSKSHPSTLAALVTAALLAACSSHHATSEAPPEEPIPECDAFVSAYEHCLESLGPVKVAEARAQQSRAALLTQTQAAHGDVSRAALQKQCAANLAQISATCR